MKTIYRSLSNRKLFLCLTAIAIAFLVGGLVSEQLPAQQEPPSGGSNVEITAGEAVVPSEFVGDVRDLPQVITPEERKLFHPPLELEFDAPSHKKPLPWAQPEIPIPMPGPLAPMPTPAVTFNAMNFASNGAGHPPDTVGDVGPNHFVQAVNTSIGIYNKTGGAAISTFTFNSLWSGAGTGTPCDTIHNGDPTVVYDPQNDRFIVADFSWTDIVNGPYYECIAVSKTSNPVTGGWWRYAVRADDAAHPWLPDYPKMGIWPDGLYMSVNMFDCLTAGCGSASYQEVRVYAFNLSDLVSGAVLRSVVVDTSNARFTLLPSNYREAPRLQAGHKLLRRGIPNSLRLGSVQVHPELYYTGQFDIYRTDQCISGRLHDGGRYGAPACSW